MDQDIHDMEGIGDASEEGGNSMDQLFAAALSVNRSAALLFLAYMPFFHG